MSFKKLISLSGFSLIANMVNAQEAAAPAEQQIHFVEIFMAVIAVVLAFVIWGLGNILVTFARQVYEKTSKENLPKKTLMISGLLLLSAGVFAQDTIEPATASASSINYGGFSATAFWLLATVIATEFIVIFALVFHIRQLHQALQAKPAPVPVVEKENKLIALWHKLDRRFFTKAPPVAQEADILLDHDYDGIKELDNALPPWWKYGFYVTILLAVFYLLRFHVWGTGPSPEEEYASEMKAAEIQIAAYMAKAKDVVDENNVAMADESGIEEGKILYNKSCVACHGAAGEGTVGPNLTDDYWLHGGSLNDIYKTVKYGYPDKGMQAWESQFSPKQMRSIASFVKKLQGTNPANGKAPQGELYKEAPQQDSTAVSKESTGAVALR